LINNYVEIKTTIKQQPMETDHSVHVGRCVLASSDAELQGNREQRWNPGASETPAETIIRHIND